MNRDVVKDVKIGIVFQPTELTATPRDDGQALLHIIRQARRAEELGFHSIWATEHHFQPFGGLLSAPHVVYGAIAQATERIRLGTTVVVLPLHDPLRVAEEWATLDQLSNGRVDIGIGRGFSPWEFRNFGIDPREGTARLEESLAVLLQAWSHGKVTFAGQHYNYDDVRVMPRALQTPHPPIWVAASKSPETFAWAGRNGHNLMISIIREDFAVLAELVALYRETLQAHGWDPSKRSIYTNFRVHVAPTREQAKANAESALYRYLGIGRANGQQESGRPEEPREEDLVRERFPGSTWDELSAQRRLLVGTPDDCLNTIAFVRERLGVTHVGATFQFGDLRPDKVEESMGLFGREVLPLV